MNRPLRFTLAQQRQQFTDGFRLLREESFQCVAPQGLIVGFFTDRPACGEPEFEDDMPGPIGLKHLWGCRYSDTVALGFGQGFDAAGMATLALAGSDLRLEAGARAAAGLAAKASSNRFQAKSRSSASAKST